ncbi:hypothetical protein Ciccas_004301 [Cichlidogyrus casuarinus]|uniref:Helicase SKI2W n=1 Tax=Cichlidogyrus casuarinus TaxID=1844966 RepID=A0ABD2QCV4_9PLAT
MDSSDKTKIAQAYLRCNINGSTPMLLDLPESNEKHADLMTPRLYSHVEYKTLFERDLTTGHIDNIVSSEYGEILLEDLLLKDNNLDSKIGSICTSLKNNVQCHESVSADENAEEIIASFLKSTPPLEMRASEPIKTTKGVEYIEEEFPELVDSPLTAKAKKAMDYAKTFAVMENISQTLPSLKTLLPEPAFDWPFELDTFQKQAILCLEKNQSVFVAAHTSAGKTVVAEYACALCRKRGSRAIFTSPIKALSNQKFRDFRKVFKDDVGLLTGDIKIAVKSSILIMTTEILHNMLTSSADTIRDLEIVIMDEVHYLNDRERGHIWEEIMIMLPRHITLVLLSATVPNTLEFADWLGRVRAVSDPIHVVMTHKRPVPLEHNLFLGTTRTNRDQVFMVVDQTSRFNIPGFRQAAAILDERKKKALGIKTPKPPSANANQTTPQEMAKKEQKKAKDFTGGKKDTPGKMAAYTATGAKKSSAGYHSELNTLMGLIEYLQEKSLLPTIAFFFSRARLESTVYMLKNQDLLTKSAMHDRLKASDRNLPNVRSLVEMLQRGIGMHHARMLPLMKEIVEMLFSRGLVRILFATETFAMGVNMPARCVVFSSLRKHDGSTRRLLTSSEYIQMAGRAGRRGIDSTGTVIILVNSPGSPQYIRDLPLTQLELEKVITGKATQLQSQFRVTYSMLLHLHRVDWITPQEVMRQSFMQAGDLKIAKTRQDHLMLLNSRVASSTVSKSVLSTDRQAMTSKTAWLRSRVQSELDGTAVNDLARVKCPDESSTACIDPVSSYFLTCTMFRRLQHKMAQVMINCGMEELITGPLCPGRLVAFSSRTSRSNQLPWLSVGMVVNIRKPEDRNTLQVDLIGWNVPEGSSLLQGQELLPVQKDEFDLLEEAILSEEESGSTSQAPWPPQLMPIFGHSKLDQSKDELLLLEAVPLYRVHAISPMKSSISSVLASNNRSKAEESSARLVKVMNQHKNELIAKREGFFLRKKTDDCHRPGDLTDDHILDQINADLVDYYCTLNSNPGQLTCNLDLVQSLKIKEPWVYEYQSLLLDLTQGLDQSKQARVSGSPSILVEGQRRAETAGFSSQPTDTRILGLTRPQTPLLEWFNSERNAEHSDGRTLAPTDECPCLLRHFHRWHRHMRREWAIARLKKNLADETLPFYGQYLARLSVLEQWKFVDRASSVGCLTPKGRVACEVSHMECIIAEILLDGVLSSLASPADMAALISCFVVEGRGMGNSIEARKKREAKEMQKAAVELEKANLRAKESTKLIVIDQNDDENKTTKFLTIGLEQDSVYGEYDLHELIREIELEGVCDVNDTDDGYQSLDTVPEHLQGPIKRMLIKAVEFLHVQNDCGVENALADAQLNPVLVKLTHAWATGSSFASVIGLTTLSEGDVVRSLQRLDELLRHIHSSCYHLGDHGMALRLDEARGLIRRGVVCAPSLYISEDAETEPTDEDQLPDKPDEQNDDDEQPNDEDDDVSDS